MVATEIARGPCVVELGCGNGRDSLYMAGKNHNVCAVDLSHEAVKSCNKTAEKYGFDTAKFLQGDLSSPDDIEKIFKTAREMSQDGTVIGYSRFVMHSINDEQEAKFLNAINQFMKSGELIYFEFRNTEDATLEKTYGNHYRRFVDTQAFIASLTETHNFKLNYEFSGRGMAKYKSEDPFVSRLIFEKV